MTHSLREVCLVAMWMQEVVCATRVCAAGKRSFYVVFWVKDLEKDLAGSGEMLNATPDLELIRLIRSHLGELHEGSFTRCVPNARLQCVQNHAPHADANARKRLSMKRRTLAPAWGAWLRTHHKRASGTHRVKIP